jgi:hypothetical protein
MRTYILLVRNTGTGIQRAERVRASSASDVRSQAAGTLAADEVIEEVRWAD